MRCLRHIERAGGVRPKTCRARVAAFGCSARKALSADFIAALLGARTPALNGASSACVEHVTPNAYPQLRCTVCKTDFISKRADAEFCSSACRQWAYRLRKLGSLCGTLHL